MLLEFKTARNKTNGHRHYLAIDTGAECYSTNCPYIITPGIEIKKSDYNELIEKLNRANFERVERCF